MNYYNHQQIAIPLNFPIYANLVKIPSIGDGSCFIHSILNAFYVPYRTGIRYNNAISKEIVKNFRYELADMLSEPIDPTGPTGPIDPTGPTDPNLNKTYYDCLSRGQLRELSKKFPEYSLESLKNELRSNADLSYIYHEFISEVLNKDIYILNSKTKDVYVIGDELDLFYKNRNSIILFYGESHFDLVGLDNNNQLGATVGATTITTLFQPNSNLIMTIKNRYQQLIKIGSSNRGQVKN